MTTHWLVLAGDDEHRIILIRGGVRYEAWNSIKIAWVGIVETPTLSALHLAVEALSPHYRCDIEELVLEAKQELARIADLPC